jgi:hypothetical protein
MALSGPPLIPAMIGLTVQGDLGGWTFYTSKRGQIVFYPQAPPLNPASYDQAHYRNRFRASAQQWRQLSLASKRAWTTVAHHASLTITGYNLWTAWYMTNDTNMIRTLERQTHIDLLDGQGNAIQ